MAQSQKTVDSPDVLPPEFSQWDRQAPDTLPPDFNKFDQQSGLSPSTRAVIRDMANQPFPEVPKGPALIRFLKGAGKTYVGATLNAGPTSSTPSGYGTPEWQQLEEEWKRNGRPSMMQTLKDSFNTVLHPTQSPIEMAGTVAGQVSQPIKNVAEAIRQDPAEGTGSALMSLLLLKAGYKQMRGAKTPEFGSPPQVAEIVRPLTKPALTSRELLRGLEAKGAIVDPKGFNDATQTYIRPSKMGTRQGIDDMLAAAKKGGSADTTGRVDAHRVSKTMIGEQVAGETEIVDPTEVFKSGLAAFKQHGPNDPGYIKNPAAIEQPTASDIRAASSPNSPRSSLAKNQKQLSKYNQSLNSPAEVEAFQEQAAQELFGKSFKDLPLNDPLMRYKATLRATQLQTAARARK